MVRQAISWAFVVTIVVLWEAGALAGDSGGFLSDGASLGPAPLPPGSGLEGDVSSVEAAISQWEPAPQAYPTMAAMFAAEVAQQPAPVDPCCDPAKRKALAKAVAGAYKGLYYDNKFDYLRDPCYNDWHLGESGKRLPVGRFGTFDIGGEYRLRYHGERNMRGLGLTGRDDSFLLHRFRLYANLELGDRFRAYAEGIDAHSNYEVFGPRPIEENRTELQNLFGDVKLWEGGRGDAWARVGRQELLYGAERTVSPLDWANTRRTFEGYNVMWQGRKWDIDAFYVNPISPVNGRLDTPDQSREFWGVYSSYKAWKHTQAEFYFLRLDESERTPFNFNTFGTRLKAERGVWLGEFEGGYQFGDFGAADHSTGAFTTGLGRKFPGVTWTPALWLYYDWAEGDDVQGNGYHHMFPLSHKYLGFMDLFGRRNIQDLNVLLTAQPRKKLKLLAWWHTFWLQRGDDVPYTVVMTPYVATPGGSKELGQEIDLVAKYKITPRSDILFGYSHFFSGDWFSTNPSPAAFDGDADFYYTQFAMKF